MAIILKPPSDLGLLDGCPEPRIFLAGSIEQGQAESWQTWFEQQLIRKQSWFDYAHHTNR